MAREGVVASFIVISPVKFGGLWGFAFDGDQICEPKKSNERFAAPLFLDNQDSGQDLKLSNAASSRGSVRLH